MTGRREIRKLQEAVIPLFTPRQDQLLAVELRLMPDTVPTLHVFTVVPQEPLTGTGVVVVEETVIGTVALIEPPEPKILSMYEPDGAFDAIFELKKPVLGRHGVVMILAGPSVVIATEPL